MKTKPNSGYVLVVVISLLSILLVIGLAFAGFTIYGLKHTSMIRDNSQAYYAARAGIARAIQTANTGGNKENSLTFEILPFASTTSGVHKIIVTTRWKPATESILIPGGGQSLEITSMGTVQTGDNIKARRIIKAYTDPASGNQRLLSQTDMSNADSSVMTTEKK
jgi:Tfp pilus assembly protein PilX